MNIYSYFAIIKRNVLFLQYEYYKVHCDNTINLTLLSLPLTSVIANNVCYKQKISLLLH